MVSALGFISFLLVMSAVLSGGSLSSGYNCNHANDSVMTAQAKAFVENMPEGLQSRQEEAVRLALAGDNSILENVRSSRNVTVELPRGVRALDINGKYRIYEPEVRTDVKLPVLIYLHGGGWCFGSINSCSRFCAELVKESGIAVLAVEYPLAPENPYPAALNFCTETVGWVYEHAKEYGFDRERISIGGDSAGGNLALAVALNMIKMSENHHDDFFVPSLRSLVLFYPVVKVWNDGSLSWKMYGKGFGLDGGIMEAFNEAYLDGMNPETLLVSPFCASAEHLALLPEVLMINADHDILRDQGEEMCDKLLAAGVKVTHKVLPGTTHLFITVAGQQAAFSQSVALASSFLLSQCK